MKKTLPELYFRIRDTGALVFRLTDDPQNGRLDMTQIAVINLATDQLRETDTKPLGEADRAAIHTWIADRKETLAWRRIEHVSQTIEALNETANWAQNEATAEEIDTASEALFLAMHDLRSVLVRKKAETVKTPKT